MVHALRIIFLATSILLSGVIMLTKLRLPP